MKVHWSTLLLLAILFSLTAPLMANDPGDPDTVRVVYTETDPGVNVGVPITLFNDENVSGYSLGFTWDSPDITVDSLSYVGSRVPPSSFIQTAIDNGNQRLLAGMVDFSALNPITPGDGMIFKIWFNVPGGTPDQFVHIDSTFVPPGGQFVLSLPSGSSALPQFNANDLKIGNPALPPTIDLSANSYVFNAQIGGGNPNSQVLHIENTGGGTLDWTATWDAPWLIFNPGTGTAPSVVVVAANITGLSAGTYIDSVEITGVGATNNPQYVEVTLNLTVPPPTIALDPDSFYFQVLQDSANPDPQVLSIDNVGMGTLNWTATESAPWLSLSATSGTGPSEDTLYVDNTGLGPGIYTTQVQISDPTASNNPQNAKVVFEVFSAFPVIEFAPDSIYAVGSGSVDPYDRTLYISNGGGGVLSWSLSESASWLSLSADTGSAVQGSPSAVTLSFDGTSESFGIHHTNLTISSSNATNSPVVVQVTYWKAENPQTMSVGPSSLTFNTVECGVYPAVPSQTFLVTKSNSSPNLNWTASYNAPWLSVSPMSGANNATVTVSIDDYGLAPGSYVDTITVSSEVTLNPSESVIVTLNVAPSPASPDLALSRDSLLFIFRYTLVGTAQQNVIVYAEGGGCLDWDVTPSVPWLSAQPDTGTTLGETIVRADAVGQPLGRQTGELIFTSSTAPNSPVHLPVVLWVYTLGDANGDGIVNITDVVYIIDWIFQGGPAPVPLTFVGDADCNHRTDISDAVYLLSWIFVGGPPPCAY